MDWSRALRYATDSVLSVVLAPTCAACGKLLDYPTHGAVCQPCWHSIRPLTSPLCDRCGDPLPTWRSFSLPLSVCPRCRRTICRVDRTRAIGEYDGALRAIIHAIKYEGRRSLARPLAELMRIRGADVLKGADGLVPVPLHRSRRRERGFNQAADLARHLDLPVHEALRRLRATASQIGLPAAQRHRNVRNAFGITRAARGLVGSTIVLIDDVTTTGATLEACALALKEAGIREVRALTAARVVNSTRLASGH
jgi:ComF family protein